MPKGRIILLLQQLWMNGLTALQIELRQAEEEGKAISDAVRAEAQTLEGAIVNDREAIARAEKLYAEIQTLPQRKDFPYREPNGLEEIFSERPEPVELPLWTGGREEAFEKIYGGWLGRSAGCLLGQPVEGWRSERITGLLRESGNYPIKSYISSELPLPLREKYDVVDEGGAYGAKKKGWINNVSCMPEDDDTNYTVLALKLVEDYGRDFTPSDVGECWLSCLPLLHTCTAERAAYINLCNLRLPPESAVFCNPYREWIGAQIRGDLFGYINPGNPEKAAEMAWRDASISHVKNGIYGEMFASAMIASAFVLQDPEKIVLAGLGQIPKNCRLASGVRQALEWRRTGKSLDESVALLRRDWDECNPHDWCHTIPNAVLVVLGLLYGEMDFTKSIGIGTVFGFDTDCNSATIGSILGVALGEKALPEEWKDPLHDTMLSGVHGFGRIAISELAHRSEALCQ